MLITTLLITCIEITIIVEIHEDNAWVVALTFIRKSELLCQLCSISIDILLVIFGYTSLSFSNLNCYVCQQCLISIDSLVVILFLVHEN